MPLTMASRPPDSGRADFSSIRSASWTISAISPSTGSSRPYSLRKVSMEQSSPRWESLAPTTSKSFAPSGASAGSPKNAKEAPGSMKRLISQMQAVRSTWHPRRVAHSISAPALCACGPGLRCAAPHGLAGGLERGGRFGSQRRAEEVPAPLRPELAFDLAQLLRQVHAAHLGLATQALGLRDDGPVGLLPRGAEGLHQLGFLGQRARPGLPQGRLAPGLPHPELQPLQLLAGEGVLRERSHPVLDVEGAEVPELSPHRHAVARGLPGQAVDQEHPARPLHGPQPAPMDGPDRRGLRAGTLEVLPGFQPALQGVRLDTSPP